MKAAWLADEHDPPGGAELTQAEFRAAAPEGVETIEVPPAELERARDCDVVCVFNSVTYAGETIRALVGKRVVRYWNDMAPHGDDELKDWLLGHATNVFCSPLHVEHFGYDNGHKLIPPPVDLERFRAADNGQERAGAVSVAAWMNPGKAAYRVVEWAEETNTEVAFFGVGPFAPVGTQVVAYADMPTLLARYETFVFLPAAVEPFGRLVAEAYAAGCSVIVNRLVGARYWLDEDPDAIESAAGDFWELVDGAAG